MRGLTKIFYGGLTKQISPSSTLYLCMMTSIINTYDVIHMYIWRHPYIHMTSSIYTYDVIHIYIWRHSYIHMASSIYTYDLIHIYIWRHCKDLVIVFFWEGGGLTKIFHGGLTKIFHAGHQIFLMGGSPKYFHQVHMSRD